ncbi:hypothetical protein YPPY01_1814, partial [Yersinia pestis PY-01]
AITFNTVAVTQNYGQAQKNRHSEVNPIYWTLSLAVDMA